MKDAVKLLIPLAKPQFIFETSSHGGACSAGANAGHPEKTMTLFDAPPTTRRHFLRDATKIAVGIALAAGSYGAVFERQHVVVRYIDIPLARLPEALDGLTIAQLSDFHYHPLFSAGVIRKALAFVHLLQPDIVALTGDFVTLSEFRDEDPAAAQAVEPCAELLASLRPPLGVYAVLGNHDTFTDPSHVAAALSARGFKVLENQAIPIEKHGKRIWIAGVQDALGGFPDLDATLARVPRKEPVVLLAHEPDFADEAAQHLIDLQLSGHSHGGQVRLPFLPPLALPRLGRKYPIGLRTLGRMKLYTNIGLGTIGVPMRIGATPEVTLFTLRTSTNGKP